MAFSQNAPKTLPNPSSTAQSRLTALLKTIQPPPSRYGQALPKCWVPLQNQPARHPRKLRVVTIGGGFSAMTLAYTIQHELKLDDVVEHCVYEKDEVLGGTWWVNRYPGVACDVPAHIYTFPFEPNPNWTAFYASGSEIHAYFQRTVQKYNLARDVKTSHRVTHAQFDAQEGIWNLKIQDEKGRVFSDWCNALISATGFLSDWKWPSIPGLDEFGGLKVHSAAWDDGYEYAGKKIAVIGNGSSAIQIMPVLAEKADKVANFVRNATWITPGLGSAVIGGQVNKVYSEEEKRRFREDPEALKRYRKQIQHGSNASYAMFEKDSAAQRAAFKATSQMMLDRLGGDKALAEKLIPNWEVGCRRATPGPGYLEAFTKPHVSLITDAISHIDETGIVTNDGTHHEFDVIVCATGFDVSHRPAFPLIGLNGIDLGDQWKDEPYSYLSLMAPNFPNLFMFSGPNAPVGHGSLMAGLSWSASYMCRWLQKISSEDIKYVVPTTEATEEFNAYGDEIMQRLVWSGGCRSWYKNNRVDGRVTAVWPGSAISYLESISELRAEDFNIQWRTRNRFRWMGNGRTKIEGTPGADLAFYLKK